MHESWRWLTALYNDLNENTRDWSQLDHVIDACIEQMPHLAGIKDAAPDAAFRIRGQKLAREPHRYSGRTAMLANVSVHEQRQPQDKDTAFAFSMEGTTARQHRVSKFRLHGRGLELTAGMEQIPGGSGWSSAFR